MTLIKQVELFEIRTSSSLDCEPPCKAAGENKYEPKKQDKKRIKNKGTNKVCCQ